MGYPKVDRAHIVPKSYLSNFARVDRIAMRLREGKSVVVGVEDAAVRRAFYRRTRPDGTKTDDIETTLSHLESICAPLMREIENRWPLSHHEKGQLAQFIALQRVRTPDWRRWHIEFLEQEIESVRKGETDQLPDIARGLSTERVVEGLKRGFGGDTQRIVRMLALVPKAASVFGSMHWSLVRFEAPLLVTGDQPVVIWPLEQASTPAQPTRISAGLLPTLEVRLPLSPRLALLLTWSDEPDGEEPIHRGSKHHAKNFNAFTVAHAERQWFHLPEASPALGAGKWLPLSLELIPGYNAEAAYHSRRRQEISRRIQSRLGTGIESSFDIVAINRRQAPAEG